MNVAFRLPCDPVALAPLQKHVAVLRAVDHVLAEALHEDARELVLPDH